MTIFGVRELGAYYRADTKGRIDHRLVTATTLKLKRIVFVYPYCK
jgi:hypothetical protein